jgi:hypothetical protein
MTKRRVDDIDDVDDNDAIAADDVLEHEVRSMRGQDYEVGIGIPWRINIGIGREK